jgi:hypothetical protein
VPAVVKLYPLLMFAVPAALRRRRTVLLGVLAALLLSVGVPAALYGSRWWPLTESFVRNELLDPRGRAFESFVAPSLNSHGIDDVLFRYLSRAFPSGRGSAAPPPLVLALGLAHAFRAFVLAVTVVAARRGSMPGPNGPRRAVLLMMALWCAALYLVLPGVKARYAIYCYPALLSLLAAAAAARTRGEAGRARALTGIVVLVVALILQAMPPGLRATGLRLAGSVLLWVAVLREGAALSPR